MTSFVDRVRVYVEAGKGGAGAVAFRREAHVPRGGPSGGDGGDGGDVVLVGDAGLSTLLDLRYRKHLRAEAGRPGGSKDRHGRAGRDLEVRVPLGTVAICEEDLSPGGEQAHPRSGAVPRELGEVLRHGQRLVIARGGRGGRGNIHFRGPTRQAPDEAEPGTPGEARWIRLELKVLADVGIVGFPNTGKSTLLASVSRARPKIADYPFTTVRPNLGLVRLDEERSMVLADVPGLIEGASDGRGLGHAFLRHLERTKVLLFLLSFEPGPDRGPARDLAVLERELTRRGGFEDRARVVAVNKMDAWTDEEARAVVDLEAALRVRGIPLLRVSAATGAGVRSLLEELDRFVRGSAALGGGRQA